MTSIGVIILISLYSSSTGLGPSMDNSHTLHYNSNKYTIIDRPFADIFHIFYTIHLPTPYNMYSIVDICSMDISQPYNKK